MLRRRGISIGVNSSRNSPETPFRRRSNLLRDTHHHRTPLKQENRLANLFRGTFLNEMFGPLQRAGYRSRKLLLEPFALKFRESSISVPPQKQHWFIE